MQISKAFSSPKLHDGTATLYAVNPHNTASSMLQGSSSLNRETLGASSWVVRDADALIEPITVRTQRLTTLLGEFGVQDIDYMVVDTEGHDAVIVNQALALERPPQMILYEHNLLPRDEQMDVEARPGSAGYDLRHLRRDTFAWQPDA